MIASAVVSPAAAAAPRPGRRLRSRLAIQSAAAGTSLIGMSVDASVTGVAAMPVRRLPRKGGK